MCMIEDTSPQCSFRFTDSCRARKEHWCDECARAILRGERYSRVMQKVDGNLYMWKTCRHCECAASYLKKHCDGYVVGHMLDDMHSHWTSRLPQDRLWLGRAIIGMRREWRRRDGGLMAELPDLQTQKETPK